MTKILIGKNNMTIAAQQLDPQNKVTFSVSYNGFEFDYLDNTWVLNRNVTVKLDFLSQLNTAAANDVRETLTYFAENYSGHHTSNLSKQLKLYLKTTDANDLSVLGLLTFKGSLLKKDEYKLAVLRGLIRQMRYLELNSNIDDEVYKLLDQWRLSGNEKGVPVLSLDPETGPFSAIEFEAIGLCAAHKYAEGVLSTEQYATLLLFKATGRRSEQLASLKVKDCSISSKYTGSPTYIVNIPRSKQRGGKFRTSFRAFGLVKSTGQVIEQHIKELIAEVQFQLGRNLTSLEQNELPLFVGSQFIDAMKTLSLENSLIFLKSELAHTKSSELGRSLTGAVNKLNVVSERTGQLIHVNPYRFRYTVGTRAAIEGAGILTIATLLDQSDTQNTGVYVANVPEFAIEISKIMNQPLARYAAAFAGRLVKDEDEANKENEGATRIPLREKACDVGSCGSNAFCQDYAPIACYLCPKFRPWANSPHHLVLEWLMEERERLKADTAGDMMIVTINDRAIIAVCQVIKLCEERNND